MRKRRSKTRRKRKPGRREDETLASGNVPRASKSANERLGAFYAAGPAFGIGLMPEEEEAKKRANQANVREEEEQATTTVETVPAIHGIGDPEHETAYINGQNVRLQGRTDATFDGGSFRTENVRTQPGQGCQGCSGANCVHVTGTLVITYSVTTTVTLPSVNDFPDLTPCQRRRVQDAIDNVLRPHEEEHVQAFETYNGTTRQPFDLTLCRNDFNDTIRSMFEAEEGTRRSAAQAASDALDPFHFEVDLDCEEESTGASDEEPEATAPMSSEMPTGEPGPAAEREETTMT